MKVERDAQALLQHRRFVRAVAAQLLRDENAVDDVEQQTWLAALRAPPRGAVRAWLGRVARNFALREIRARARRERRERAVSRPEALVETLQWQQRVVETVLRLEARYRDAVLLRFYEELPPREIARRLGVPVNTVRTQLRRALDRLRADLDEGRGGRRAWCLGLLPLLDKPGRLGPWLVGAMVVGTKMKVATLLLGAALAALLFSRAGDSPQPPRESRTVPGSERHSFAVPPPPERPDRVVAAGLVLGPDGAPVEGATVEAWLAPRHLDGFLLASDPLELLRASESPAPVLATVLSAAEGRFRLELPRAASVVLRARKGGLASAEVTRLELARDQHTIVLRLAPTFALEGRVVDLTGDPVAGAQLTLLPPPGGPTHQSRFGRSPVETLRGEGGTSAADGTFRIAGLAPGGHALLVRRTGFVAAFRPSVLAPADRLVIRLVPGGPVEGRVVLADGVTPAPGAIVRLISDDGGAAPLETRSDDAGSFLFEAAPVHAAFRLLADAGRAGSAPVAREGQRYDGTPIVIRLDPPRTVLGRVVRKGEPDAAVPGVRLYVWQYMIGTWTGSYFRAYAETESDADGRFRFDGLQPAGLTVNVHPDDPAFDGFGGTLVAEGARGDDVVVEVVPRRAVEGRVVDERGRPVAGAEVGEGRRGYTRFGPTDAEPGARRVFTGADGAFSLRGLSPQPGTVVVARKEGVGRGEFAMALEGAIEVVLRPYGTITGEAREGGGDPLPGALVRVSRTEGGRFLTVAEVFAGPDGRFAAPVVAGGSYRIDAEREGYVAAFAEGVAPDGPAVRLELARGHPLAGAVLDEEGAPVGGAMVMIDGLQAWTGPDGRFEIGPVREGAHSASVSAPGFAPASVRDLRVPARDGVRFTITRGALVSGTLVDGDGRPRAHVLVFVGSSAVQTDALGCFSVRVARGRHEVRVDDPTYEPLTGVEAGASHIVLAPRSARAVGGRVLASDGTPVAGVAVRAFVEGGDHVVAGDAVTAVDGSFRFEDVRGRSLRIYFWRSGYACPVLEGVAAGRTDLEVRYAEGVAVSGIVVMNAGRMPETVYVSIEGEGLRGTATCDRSGRFEIRGLVPGRYEVTASADGVGVATRSGVSPPASDLRLELGRE